VLASLKKGGNLDTQNLLTNQKLAVIVGWQGGNVTLNATFRDDKLVSKAINSIS
jgi:hypothetical protein